MTDSAAWHMLVSSSRPGALGILLVNGNDAFLASQLDSRLFFKNGKPSIVPPLQPGALCYGWLRTADDEVLDEIMVAKPSENRRIVMIHGGASVRQAVSAFLEQAGFPSRASDDATNPDDVVFDSLLAKAKTQTQAAVILEALRCAREGGSSSVAMAVLADHRILLAGPPNAGKSSLLNHLAGYQRAFVHEEAGATLDVVEELVDLGGLAVVLGDMPGFHSDHGQLEQAAWEKASARLASTEAILFICDGSQEWDAAAEQAAATVASLTTAPVLIVVNKSDLPEMLAGEPWIRHFPHAGNVRVSSLLEGNALSILGNAVWTLLGIDQ